MVRGGLKLELWGLPVWLAAGFTPCLRARVPKAHRVTHLLRKRHALPS